MELLEVPCHKRNVELLEELSAVIVGINLTYRSFRKLLSLF
jgi:hypothetical protein